MHRKHRPHRPHGQGAHGGDVGPIHSVARHAGERTQAEIVGAEPPGGPEWEAAEATYRAAFHAAPMAVVVLDRQGLVRHWNPSAERLFGWAEADVVGRPYPLAPPERQGEFARNLARALRGEMIAAVETWRRKRDGTPVAVRIEAVPLRGDVPGPTGPVTGVVIFLQDLTERRALEEQVRQAQKLDAVGRLAAGVAHDFNNLLTVMFGFTDLLLLQLPAGSELRAHAGEIRKAGERAAALTGQLLALSRRQVVEPRVLDVNAIVHDTHKTLRRLLGEEVTLTLALGADLGRVKADAGQLHQVLINLAVNARDAMPGGGHVTIETRNVLLDDGYTQTHFEVSPGPYVLLALTDTGSGMDEHVRQHLFEPFFTTKPAGQGTGLGLATVYAVVRQSGGTLSVYSEPGHGTTFKIYLPHAEGAVGERANPEPDAGGLPGGMETILVVDDDPGVRRFLVRALRRLGYTVLPAGSLPEALQVSRGHSGDIPLVVTDVVMPGGSGRELSDTLTAERPGLRTLYLSGYPDDAIVRHGLLQGSVAFLGKPFRDADLAYKVREVLGAPAP